MIKLGHLDLNIVTHCNNRCVACSHAAPFAEPWFMDLETIEHDFKLLKDLVHFQFTSICGGEPLLHPKLVEIMNLIKSIRIDVNHLITTNGKLLPRMSDDFWNALEYLQISLYPNLDRSIIRLAEEKSRKHRFGLGVRESNVFFKQFDNVPDGSSFHNCRWKIECYTVHNGYFFMCPESLFFPKRFMGLEWNVDGVQLEGLTENGLLEFIGRKTPLNACRTCRSYVASIPWSEASTFEEWKQKSTI